VGEPRERNAVIVEMIENTELERHERFPLHLSGGSQTDGIGAASKAG
jgi:hypothetical protein